MPVWSALVVSCLFAVNAAAQSSDMFVTKSAPGSATVGSNITYTITLGNLGPDDAPGAHFTDSLPTGATFVSRIQNSGPMFTCSDPNVGDDAGTVACNIATLIAGDSATFSIVVNVSPSAAGTTLINSVTTGSDNPDDNPENNSFITGTDVPAVNSNLADIAITKTGPVSAPPNTDITYTITVTNVGPNNATNVSWTDTLPNSVPPGNPLTFVSFNQTSGPTFNCPNPGATVNCSIATLNNGVSATFQYVAHIPNVAAGTDYTNTATVTSDNDPTPENNTASATTTVSSADVGITKSGPAVATAGGPNFTYTIMVSNGGPDTASDVTWVDSLPSGVNFVSFQQDTGPTFSCDTPPQTVNTISCSIAVLGNGQSAQFTITANAASTVSNGTVLSNTATVSSASSDPNTNNNSSTVSTTVSANADVAITKSAPATAVAGTNINYTINIMNNGPATAASVSWVDVMPASTTFVSLTQNSGPAFNCTTGATVTCSIASLAPVTTGSFTLVVSTPPSLANGTVISNTVNASSTTPDSSPNNNSATAQTTIQTSADLSVTKSAPAAATAGSNVTYTINVANAGPSDASAVTLTDVLPAGTTFVSENQTSGPAFNCTTGATVTCSIASFTNGAAASFSVTVTFSAGLANGSGVTNTANITSATSDPNPTNNSSSALTTVGANADLSVTKSGPTFTASTTNAIYTVTATNSGPSNASNVTLTETVPANMTFVSVNQTSGPVFNCTGTGPIVCTIATLNAGTSATFQFTFFVTNAPQGTQTSNTATISSTTLDPTPVNNASTVNTTIGLPVPAMSDLLLALLALALVGIAMLTMRR
jgi:uncharacterized repeat protein (TIGR01451 family)